MKKPRMYSEGEPVDSLDAIVAGAALGRWLWVTPWKRATHPSIILNMSVTTVDAFLKHGRLHWAAKNGVAA